MKIITDSREQLPYEFSSYQVEISTAALPAGDYSLAGFTDRIGIERKSLDDLIGCLTGKDRDRFERELAKAGSFERFVVVVESSLQDVSFKRYRSAMSPHSVLQSVTAFYIRYGVPFLFCGDRAGGEYITHSILSKYLYEIDKRYQHARKAG